MQEVNLEERQTKGSFRQRTTKPLLRLRQKRPKRRKNRRKNRKKNKKKNRKKNRKKKRRKKREMRIRLLLSRSFY